MIKYYLIAAFALVFGFESFCQVEYLVLCNTSAESVVVKRKKDTAAFNFPYRVLKANLPNKAVAQKWVQNNFSDGTCPANAASETIVPNLPSNAGAATSTSPAKAPQKKVKLYYKNYRLFSYGQSFYNLSEIPEFQVNSSVGQYFGFRFQKGNQFQFGFSAAYVTYGEVDSYEDGPNQAPSAKTWGNIDLHWLVSRPIEIRNTKGQIWIVPQAGLGLSLQNISRVEHQDIDVELNDNAYFSYELKLGVELFHLHFALGYQNITTKTFKDISDFSFNGIVLSAGIAL